MNKWIAEFELEDGDTMPEHMDLEYKGVRIDFHCKPLEQESTTKNDLALIHTEGLDEGIRCAMCTNSIKSDRGCDGGCVVNNAMYKAVMDVIEKSIQPTTRNDLGVDCISRAQTQTEIEMNGLRYTIAKERCGMGQVEWSDQLIKVSDAVDIIRNLPPVTSQEPFINKPCVSSGVCEHDKNKVLDKLRAEIENDWQLKKYPSSPFSCGLRRAIEILDKYKGESEENNAV